MRQRCFCTNRTINNSSNCCNINKLIIIIRLTANRRCLRQMEIGAVGFLNRIVSFCRRPWVPQPHGPALVLLLQRLSAALHPPLPPFRPCRRMPLLPPLLNPLPPRFKNIPLSSPLLFCRNNSTSSRCNICHPCALNGLAPAVPVYRVQRRRLPRPAERP